MLPTHTAVQEQRRHQARWIFRLCLGYTVAGTLLWLIMMLTGIDGGIFFGQSRPALKNIIGFAIFFTGWNVVWSYGFYWLKYWLLKRAGLTKAELQLVFGVRLHDFDLEAFLQNHSERTIRIIDMVSRRGRTILLAFVSTTMVYMQTSANPTPESLIFGLQSSLFDAMIMSWWSVLTYHSSSALGHMAYGAHSRILDGIQGRANVLCITTLWNGFKFVMIPLGLQLAIVYPAETYAVLYAMIWLSYMACDFASEIFGSLYGKHGIRVWGLGDINRKSWAGVVAGFICTLLLNLCLVGFNGFPAAWLVLGLILSVVNPFVELYSPRGTDDFVMATLNAAICLGYGWLVFAV